MTKPRALQPGDTLAIVSPSSPIAKEKLERGLEVLHGAGYRTKVYPHALDANDYMAGEDKDRMSDLQQAFADPEVDAVYCSRGGYGCARLMPYLDLDAMAASGKMFLGFSDITTIHLALNRRGLVTLYSPMALSFSVERQPWVYESFLGALKGETTIPEGVPKANTLVGGTVEAELCGGCRGLLTDSLGTLDALDAAGKILLIEDIDEHPHRVDAMFTHLITSGILQSAAGIVVGEMTGTDEKVDASIGGRPWRDIIIDRVVPLGIPAVIDFPFGHVKNMLTMPLGIRARLDADTGTLTYLERCAL